MDKNTTSRTDWTNEELLDIYNEIKLPTRGTKGSAGYDFFTPINISVRYGESVVIPTSIRCRIEDGWFLNINPRSGSGFKYGIRLANTHGIIDSDYYNVKNEGHIMVKIVNNDNAVNANKENFEIEQGKGFCQGILAVYDIPDNDECDRQRTDGFGHTDNK